MPDRKRILFVDDEPELLSALSKLLRRERHRWEIVFALGGQEGLREIEQGLFDMVVTDMRMPGIDGIAVLTAVKERSRSTVRIVLSGHAPASAELQALALAHHFLAKPCDATVLRETIERGLDVALIDEEVVEAHVVDAIEMTVSPRA